MNTEAEQISVTLIRGPRIVNHEELTVLTIKLGDLMYEKSKGEVIFKDAIVKQTSEEKIVRALETIGIQIPITNKETIKIVSRKFWKELTSIEGVKLAFHQESKIFYEIVRV